MTREEAISKAINIVSYFEAHFAKSKEAREDAVNIIEALEQEPCEDAISRQAVIEVLNKMDRYVADELTLCDTERKFPQNEVFIVDDVYEEIVEQLPSVKPTVKVGHWIIYDVHGHKACKCSECNNDVGYPCNDKFCKYCGSKMQEVET